MLGTWVMMDRNTMTRWRSFAMWWSLMMCDANGTHLNGPPNWRLRSPKHGYPSGLVVLSFLELFISFYSLWPESIPHTAIVRVLSLSHYVLPNCLREQSSLRRLESDFKTRLTEERAILLSSIKQLDDSTRRVTQFSLMQLADSVWAWRCVWSFAIRVCDLVIVGANLLPSHAILEHRRYAHAC